MIERDALHLGRDVLQEGAALHRVGAEQQPTGFLHRLDHRVEVQRGDEPQIDDLSRQPVLRLQDVGGLEGPVQGGTEGGDGQVGALATNHRFPFRNLVVALRNTSGLELLGLVVEQLGLEEHHRVGAAQRQVHHALGIVGGGRVVDLQTGHVRAQRRPVLGVLGAVLVADADADHERHLQQTRGHRLPFRGLVEDLVARTPQEVAVHQLHQRATPGEGVADTGTDDRGLGDGRVEQAMVGQQLRQATVDGERATPVAVLLAPRGERRVGGETVRHGLEDRVAVGEGLVLGDRFAVLVAGGADLVLQRLDARVLGQRGEQLRFLFRQLLLVAVAVHHRVDEVHVHARAEVFIAGRQGDHLGEAFVEPLLNGVHVGLGEHLVLDQVGGVVLEAVVVLPQLHFLTGAVGGCVRRGVSGEAVGDGVGEHRSAARVEEFAFAGDGVGDGERVEAVDTFGVHGLRVHAHTDARQDVVAHGFAGGLPTHAVEVVEEVEPDRRIALHTVFPQGAVLVHGCQHHGFPDGAAAHGCVTDVRDHDACPAVDALEQRRTGGDVRGAADDGVVRHGTERGEESVHRPAEAAVETGLAGERFGDGTVEDEVLSDIGQVVGGDLLGEGEGFAVQELLHDAFQVRGIEFAGGGETLGEDLAVAAVGSEDEVVGTELRGLPHHGGFLSDAEVRGAAVVVLHTVPGAGGLDGVEHGLERAHGDHVVQDVDEPLLAVAFQFRLEVGFVGVDGDLGRRDDALGTHVRRIDDE